MSRLDAGGHTNITIKGGFLGVFTLDIELTLNRCKESNLSAGGVLPLVKKLSGSDNGSVSYEKAKGLAGLRRNMRPFLPEKIAKTRIPGVSARNPPITMRKPSPCSAQCKANASMTGEMPQHHEYIGSPV
ncbi:hypothetical protein EOK75_07310 [Pseudorhodobacter turbinis]|uniref:Uncharacterized protein n=1 Tax=Pseudorhodobacter turbinis TaxID=2500533 RepID=A0A4P8EFU1_9RHOB|nr:hypothetical protein EOK75_07310 [Pseudorhodobacter turbinis]